MSKVRRQFTREFKLQVLREVEAGKAIAQVAREYQLHPTLMGKWQRRHRADPQRAFTNSTALQDEARIAELERMVGKLTMENAFLKKVLQQLEAKQSLERMSP